ncbi:MAG: type IV pilus assembly protein PilM [Candidatus Aadella gelida]|nr:type IV pilus assembly protein PilM [Candidatus Aadella gelida]
MGKNKKTVCDTVGLDIGSYSVKLVSLGKRPDEETLRAYNIKKIPPKSDISQIKDIVKESLKEVSLFPDEVNLSLSGPDVIVRFINLPKMKKDQLENALVYEAEKYIPFNVNEVILDSIILGDAQENGQMKVLLAAAKREFVDSQINMLKEIGIKIRVMDIASFAAFNAFSWSHELPDEEVSAFINIGHSQTDVLVFFGGNPCFMRQIQVGGKKIADMISKELSIAEEDVEEYIMDQKEGSEEDIKRVMGHVTKELVKELHLSFGYFENRYNKRVDKIYCTGGIVSQKNVIELFREEIGLDIKKWDPIGQIKLADTISEDDISSVSSQLAVAIGLALRD